MPRICIGVPYHRGVSGETINSIHSQEPVAGYQTEVFYSEGALVYAVRGAVADHVLNDKDIHYLFFCDSDMVLPPYAVRRMVDRDGEIVAGLCCRRRPLYEPVIFRVWSEEAGGPVQDPTFFPMAGVHSVWGSGLACTLIKRHVLEHVREKYGPHMFFHERLKNGEPMGEDISFFWRSNALGFRTLLDADVHVGHLSDQAIWPQDAKRLAEVSASRTLDSWKKEAQIKALEARVKELENAPPRIPEMALAQIP